MSRQASARLATIACQRFDNLFLNMPSGMDLPVPRLSRPRWQMCVVSCTFLLVLHAQFTVGEDSLPGHLRSVLDAITSSSLRGHLSFIASDLLEGRDSPSRGLDIAAEYIAAQFRRASLEPVGGDGYFQTAHWRAAARDARAFRLTIRVNGNTVEVSPQQMSLCAGSAVELTVPEVLKLESGDPSELGTLTAAQVERRVVLVEIPESRCADPSRSNALPREQQAFLKKLTELKAAAVLSFDRHGQPGRGVGNGRLIDPENRPPLASSHGVPWLLVHNSDAVKIYDSLQKGLNPAAVQLSLPAPVERPAQLRNVAGLLRGSDPALRDTYILVTAHYDHVGTDSSRYPDPVFNGANDDGSGTVSVIELASALSQLHPRPKRSIVFMTVFAEEKGLLGSRYYARHPLFPLAKTVANINLEVLGRTDGTDGSQKNRASLTGFEYSDLGEVFTKAGQLTGVEVYHHPTLSDAFYPRGDNLSLAEKGVIAHSLCSAFLFPDLHEPGDHWDKVDYPNLATLNRMLAVALWMIAENPVPPRWNEAARKAAPYLKAWQELHR